MFVKIIDILVALATILKKTAKLLVKITKKEKVERDIYRENLLMLRDLLTKLVRRMSAA